MKDIIVIVIFLLILFLFKKYLFISKKNEDNENGGLLALNNVRKLIATDYEGNLSTYSPLTQGFEAKEINVTNGTVSTLLSNSNSTTFNNPINFNNVVNANGGINVAGNINVSGTTNIAGLTTTKESTSTTNINATNGTISNGIDVTGTSKFSGNLSIQNELTSASDTLNIFTNTIGTLTMGSSSTPVNGNESSTYLGGNKISIGGTKYYQFNSFIKYPIDGTSRINFNDSTGTATLSTTDIVSLKKLLDPADKTFLRDKTVVNMVGNVSNGNILLNTSGGQYSYLYDSSALNPSTGFWVGY